MKSKDLLKAALDNLSNMSDERVKKLSEEKGIVISEEPKLIEWLQYADKFKDSIFNKTATFVKDTWTVTKREGRETKQAMTILNRMIKDDKVSDNEKEFLKQQSGDIIKAIATVGISGIPVPFPITPLLIIVGKKYNFNVLPQDQQHLLDDEMKLTPGEAHTDI